MVESVFRFPIAAASRPVFHFLDKCEGFPTPTPDPDRPGHYLQFEALIGSKKQKLDLSTPDIELASMQPYVKDGKLTRYCEECQRSRKGSEYRSYVCLSQKDEDAHRIIFHPNKKKRKPSLSASATEKTEKGKRLPKSSPACLHQRSKMRRPRSNRMRSLM